MGQRSLMWLICLIACIPYGRVTASPSSYHEEFGYHEGHEEFGYHQGHEEFDYHEGHEEFDYHQGHEEFDYHEGHEEFGYHEGREEFDYHQEHEEFDYHEEHEDVNYHEGHEEFNYHEGHEEFDYHEEHEDVGYHDMPCATASYGGTRSRNASAVEKGHEDYNHHEGREGVGYSKGCKELIGRLGDAISDSLPLLSFSPSATLRKDRFWIAAGATTSLYAGTVIALNEAWYKQFPRSSFHFYDDVAEWRGMDKMGHLYASYFESYWAYKVARWTGMRENASLWTGVALGFVFQGTVETLDGFSEEWGFSLADLGCNMAGTAVFFSQQKLWGEQRILLKVSSTPITYPDVSVSSLDGQRTSSLRTRTDDLFGRGYAERFLKDYNAQTTWLSVNVASFLKEESRFPEWLNVAVGYGAENMYGGFRNEWKEDDAEFILTEELYPRYSQFYLSPDIDFSRIPSRSPFVRTLLGMLNVFKMPGPVLEVSGERGVQVKLKW